jgi:hypothetical protein
VRRLADLAVAGLINDQAATILVETDIAAPVRALVERALPAPYSDVVTCRTCAGMWIALGQAAVGSFDWHPLSRAHKQRHRFASVLLPLNRLALFIMRALAIAAAGRLAHNLTRDYLHPYEPDA